MRTFQVGPRPTYSHGGVLQGETWRVRVSQTVQRPSWLAAARQAPLGLHAQLIPASLYPLSVPNATYPVERHTECSWLATQRSVLTT